MHWEDDYYSYCPSIVSEHQAVQVSLKSFHLQLHSPDEQCHPYATVPIVLCACYPMYRVIQCLWSLRYYYLTIMMEYFGLVQLGNKVLLPPPAARRLSTDSADCIALDSDSEEETRHVATRPGMSDGSPLTVSSSAISQGLTRDNNRSPVIITIDDKSCGSINKRLKYTRLSICPSSVSSGRSWVGE